MIVFPGAKFHEVEFWGQKIWTFENNIVWSDWQIFKKVGNIYWQRFGKWALEYIVGDSVSFRTFVDSHLERAIKIKRTVLFFDLVVLFWEAEQNERARAYEYVCICLQQFVYKRKNEIS